MSPKLNQEAVDTIARRLSSLYYHEEAEMFPGLAKAVERAKSKSESDKLLAELKRQKVASLKKKRLSFTKKIDSVIKDKSLAVVRTIDCADGFITGINYAFASAESGSPVRIAVDGHQVWYKLDPNLPRKYLKTLPPALARVSKLKLRKAKGARSLFATITAVEAYLIKADATFTSTATLPHKGAFSLVYQVTVRDHEDLVLRITPKSVSIYTHGKMAGRVPFSGNVNIVNLVSCMDLFVPGKRDAGSFEGLGTVAAAIRHSLSRLGYRTFDDDQKKTQTA